MRSDRWIRTARIGYVVISAALCVIGVLMMCRPEALVLVIGRLVGVTLGLFGVVKLIGYFSRDLYRLAFQFDLAQGILLIALSVIVLPRSEHVLSLLCVILGVTVLVDSLLRIQMSLDARRFGLRTWGLILGMAIATGVVGTVLVARPTESANALTMLMGGSLLCEGMLSLCVALCAVKILPQRES